MPTRTLLFLAAVSFDFGLIDVTEYEERRQVARWMAEDEFSSIGNGDPRETTAAHGTQRPVEHEHTEFMASGQVNKQDWMELLVLGRWLFTKSDPDAYPSTPHGHLHSATRAWPKLNPYTGRVFEGKHKEDTTLRLSKREMQNLWRDHAFRDFCRSYILLFVEAHPYYAFRVKNTLRFPRW